MRLIPFFKTGTLKLINKPKVKPDNFKYVSNCAS